jgi:tetratricopeptide (TPR) repeat protein
MSDFAKIAPYLEQPLVLVGFVLLLFFSIHRALIKSGVIPRLSAQSGSKVVASLLRYGFVLALMVVVLGFGKEYMTIYYQQTTANEQLRAALNNVNDIVNIREPHIAEMVRMRKVSAEDRERLQGVIRDADSLLEKAGQRATPDNLVALGYVYVLVGQYEKAVAMFLEATNKDPAMRVAYAGLLYATQLEAATYLQSGDYERARETLEKAKSYEEIARHYYEAESWLTDQLGYIEMDLGQYYSTQGNATLAGDSYDEAAQQFKMALAVDAKDASAHNGLANTYWARGDFDKAIEEDNTATRLRPDYTFAWHDLVLTLKSKYDKKPDPQTLRSLLIALQHVFELSTTDGAQQLPPTAMQGMTQIKDWALAETAKYKKRGNTTS